MSNLTVSIDPGYRYCGVAVFQKGQLTFSELVEAKNCDNEAQQFAHTASAVWEYLMSVSTTKAISQSQIAIEYPQQYTFSPAPREAVQRLVGTIGAILSKIQSETGGLSVKVSTYKPREWKGQVPKDIMSTRVVARLTTEEAKVIPSLPKTKEHNVIDAIGVGLHHLKRLKRRRVSRSSKAAS